MTIRHSRTACAVALAIAFQSAFAATEDEAAVIVTATRFTETDLNVPANVSIITREDIRRTPALDLPAILKSRAGVDVRTLYGSLGTDATVDLRGFGETAGSNTLILLDGQRLNPIDMGSINWSAIPLESVQRIEIIRGAGTVLYGDRASGGVINIISDKSGKEHASISVNGGEHGYRSLDGNLAGKSGALVYNAFVHGAATDGWRENSQQDQQALSGRFGLDLAQGETFLDYSIFKDSSGQPGSLFRQAYRNDPRSSTKPNDKQWRDGYRLRPGVRLNVSDTIGFEAELGSERENYDAHYISLGSRSQRDKETLSFTPRLRVRHGLGSLGSETVLGYDYYDGNVSANYSTFPGQSADQTSQAFYLQNTTALTAALAMTLGARSQRMEQSAHQDAYPAWFSPAMDGDATRRRNAYDAGLNYHGQGWRAYGKFGTTFRFANTDELFGYDPITYAPVFSGDLKPQHGDIRELGGSFVAGTFSGRAAIYHLDMEDEIGYDDAAGANVNYDPTRRQGLEAEIEWRATQQLATRLSYTYSDAQFSSGIYDGQDIPLVPHHKATLAVDWNTAAAGKYSAVAYYVGKRRYAGDLANSHGWLDGYTTLDLQASWDLKPWTLTAKLLNAFDKRYASTAGYSSFSADHYYYPADGRGFFVGARYVFK
jgi:iron complex outermembrane receptor protein